MSQPWLRYQNRDQSSYGYQTRPADPLQPSQVRRSRNEADASEFAARRAEAEARRAEADAQIAARNAESRGMTSQQRLSLQDRYNGLEGFDRILNEVEGLYQQNFAGDRAGVAGFGGSRNVAGYLPEVMRESNQTFNAASGRIIDQIAQVYGITGTELNSMAELRARLGPYIPRSTDNDETIQSKLNSLRGILNEQRRSLSSALGIEQDQGAAGAAGASGGIGGSGNAPGGLPPDDPNRLVVNVTGGRRPRNPEEAWPEQREYFDRARRLNPMITFEQAMDDQARPAGRRQYDPESVTRMMGEQALSQGNMVLGPLSSAAFGLGGMETADAFRRGFMDVPTFGFADEIRGAVRSGVGGEDINAATQGERSIDRFDEQNNFGARLSGQLAGGLTLPFNPAAGLGRQALTGAAYGGAYGFGSGEGSDRLESGAIGAGIGAGAGLAGGYLNLRRSRRQDLLNAADRIGVDLTRMEAGGVPTRMAAGVIGRTFGNVPMVEGARQSSASAMAARDRIAEGIGTVLDEAGAGQAAQRGARAFLQSSATRRRELFERVPIAENREATLTGTRAALQEMTRGMQSNPQLGAMFDNPELQGFLRALTQTERDVPTGILDQAGRPITRGVAEGGNLSWADMRRFRSLIGEKIEQPTVGAEGTSRAALRRLYGAITTDMEQTAQAESPRALTMLRRAVQYDRGRHARREGVLTEILGENFSGGAEQAFDRINRWAQQRGGDFARVGQALRSMPADDANTVRATLFARMGQESAGRMDEANGQVFNASTFATQWNNLSQRARNFLIPSAEHRRNLEDLVRVTTAMRQSSQYQNFSNTSLGTNAAVLATGLFVEPVSTVALALGSLAAGKFLASRAGSGWLSRAASARTPAARRNVVGSLSSLATRDPAIAQEALGLRRILLEASNDNFERRAVASEPDEEQRRQRRQPY